MFSVYLQTIFDRSCAPFAHEALLRTPSLPGCIGKLITSLEHHEELAHLHRIHTYVLNKVIIYTNICPSPIWFNCSAKLLSPTYVESFINIIKCHYIPANLIGIEVTETFFVEDFQAFHESLSLLRQNGFTLILDDFGSGYQSLWRLGAFSFDYVKICGKLIQNFLGCPRRTEILNLLIRLIHATNALAIAEAVETQKQFSALLELGCDGFQGYWLHRPESPIPDQTLDHIEIPHILLAFHT